MSRCKLIEVRQDLLTGSFFFTRSLVPFGRLSQWSGCSPSRMRNSGDEGKMGKSGRRQAPFHSVPLHPIITSTLSVVRLLQTLPDSNFPRNSPVG